MTIPGDSCAFCPVTALHKHSCCAHRIIITVKGRNTFSSARSSVAFVFPIGKGQGGAGCIPYSVEKYLQCASKYLSPTQRNLHILTGSLGKEDTEMTAGKHFLSPVGPNSNSREWLSLSPRPRSPRSAILHQILPWVLPTLINANLNETLNIISPRSQGFSRPVGTSYLGYSRDCPCQVWPGFHQIC